MLITLGNDAPEISGEGGGVFIVTWC